MVNMAFRHAALFVRAADMHREASRTLLGECPLHSSSRLATVATYLGGYVAECALKAVLISRYPERDHTRVVDEVLKGRIGHNLEFLKVELAGRGVNWPSRQTTLLKRVRSGWSSEMRYDPRNRSTEEARRVIEAADGLYQWATGT